MAVQILFLLLNFLTVVSQQLKLSHFHKYGLKQIRTNDHSIDVKSILDCALITVASNKPFFAYPHRTCYLLESVLNEKIGDDEREAVIYKDESYKDACPEAPDVGKGGTLVSLSGFHVGAEAVYRCNEGYCGDSNTSTCLDNGTWTPGVNCTKSQTKWTQQDSLLIFLSCEFRHGSTFKSVLAISGLGKCTMAIQDRLNNILFANVFSFFTKNVKFMSEVNKKTSSSNARAKSTFQKGKQFEYVVKYSIAGYEVRIDGKKMPIFKHRSDTKPYLFNGYGKCHIVSAQMHY